jgi:hypothetical protein
MSKLSRAVRAPQLIFAARLLSRIAANDNRPAGSRHAGGWPPAWML